MIRLLAITTLTLVLSGCQFVDTYYTADQSFLSYIEEWTSKNQKDKDSVKINVTNPIVEMVRSQQLRIRLVKGEPYTLEVYSSYNPTDELRKIATPEALGKLRAETTTYNCRYFDERNWVCHNFEMKAGLLHQEGFPLKKNHRLKI